MLGGTLVQQGTVSHSESNDRSKKFEFCSQIPALKSYLLWLWSWASDWTSPEPQFPNLNKGIILVCLEDNFQLKIDDLGKYINCLILKKFIIRHYKKAKQKISFYASKFPTFISLTVYALMGKHDLDLWMTYYVIIIHAFTCYLLNIMPWFRKLAYNIWENA